ncbi:hypothetical protein DQT64_24820 [Salmonella enterica subsp. enterica serovar Stanley]|nr:hypothetical protein [Salmonella enterica subsp. enterica serovar Stanley]
MIDSNAKLRSIQMPFCTLPVYKRILLVRCLVPPGDDNQLTITADYYFHPQHEGPLCLFNCAACA